MSRVKLIVVLFAFLSLAVMGAAADLNADLSNVDSQIKHFRDVQSRINRHIQMLRDGTAVFTNVQTNSGILMLTTVTSLREGFRQSMAIAMLRANRTDYENFDKLVETALKRFLDSCKPESAVHLKRLNSEKGLLDKALLAAQKRRADIEKRIRESSTASVMSIEGTWRRTDGYTVQLTGSGDNFRGTIVSMPDSVKNLGFKVGEFVWDLKRIGPSTFKGKAKARSTGGEYWVELTFSMTTENELRASDGGICVRVGKS